jgi:CheY-like chemotaxis protein
MPIIGVSASVSEQVQQESLAAGCDDFLAKPIQLEELLDCLGRHLGLEWIYEDTTGADLEKQAEYEEPPLVVPPQDVLTDLLEWAQGGYINDIRASVARIKASDPNFIPFATRIDQLTKNFQFAQIIELIKSSMQGVKQ